VVFTLGCFQSVKGPGLVLLIPFFQELVRVDLRIQVIEIPSQDVIPRDNVSMKVDAVLYFNWPRAAAASLKRSDASRLGVRSRQRLHLFVFESPPAINALI
jgi:regulator of protease activity HflC (stomatin/prohibitin superfamily)